jgi:hypothetical protein
VRIGLDTAPPRGFGSQFQDGPAGLDGDDRLEAHKLVAAKLIAAPATPAKRLHALLVNSYQARAAAGSGHLSGRCPHSLTSASITVFRTLTDSREVQYSQHESAEAR